MTNREMYDEHRKRHPELYRSEDSRSVSRPVVQEQKAVNPGSQHGQAANPHRTKNKAVDGKLHPKFCVTIVMRHSDNRRRDNSGALETILDCIVSAAGRLKAMDTDNSYHD